jgi:putative membrane protein
MTAAHAMWNNWGWGGFEWLFALAPVALTIAFWALVVLLVAKLVKNRPAHAPGQSAALHLLEERYARGEMSRDEFLERKAVLSGHASARPPGT